MVTGSILWGLGDVVAQVAPAISEEVQRKSEGGSRPGKPSGLAALEFDSARVARACIFGGGIHAPIAHVHYNFLESLTVRVNALKWGAYGPTVFKTIMEQFVYWSWFSNALYHAAMGAMQGYTLEMVSTRLNDVLWDTMKAQWAFWIPVQLINFKFTPVRHQLNVVLVTSVVWTAFLSFAFPSPAESLTEAEEKPAAAATAAAVATGVEKR